MKMKIKKGHHLSRVVVGFILLLSFPFTFSQARADPYPQIEPEGPSLISMDFQDADLKDVLKSFSQQAGLNFIASEKVKDRKVTLYLDKVTVQDALETIIDANDLTYTQAEDSKIFVVMEIDMPEVELTTRVFTLKYAPVYEIIEPKEGEGAERGEIEPSDIFKTVEKMLTEDGICYIDVRTNSVIVKDRLYNMGTIKKLIATLDEKVPQVMIEVEVLETSLDTLKALGFEWGGKSGQLFSFSLAKSALMFPYQQIYENALGWRGGPEGITPGTLGTSDVSAVLELLTKDTETKILATPKILTSNNQSAIIMVGVKFPIIETTVSEETGKITGAILSEYQDIGVQLKVTPKVCPDNYVNMIIEPAVTSYTKTIKTKTAEGVTLVEYPIINTRETKTQLLVKDGETIIIGGLIETKDIEIMRKVPFLGDIPILGTLFRKKDVEKLDRELIFFITPHVVREGEPSIETSGSNIEPTPISPQPKRQEAAWLRKEAALERAIGEAMAKLSSEESSQTKVQEVVVPDRRAEVERSKPQTLYEEALTRYKLISEWKSLE